MAISSNRSPSPISTRPRTPEASSSVRRSYSGNPFSKPSVLSNPKSFNPATPANSPSDFQGRSFVGKDGGVSSRVYEEKENEKENCLKLSKIRSPSVGKGSKNFMSPTISAASKINASPRKKVLGERNEQVRSSLSFSDVRSSSSSVNIGDLADDFDAKSDLGLSQNKGGGPIDATITDCDEDEAILEIPPVIPKPQKRVTFTGSRVISDSQNASPVTDVEDNEAILEVPPVVSKPPKKVTFTGSQVIPDSQNASESLPIPDFEDSEAILEVPPVVSKPPEKATFLGSDVIISISKPPNKVTFEESPIDVEPVGSANKPPSMSPIIAPLDADPSHPPYDPKTNFLSPRPQFLRYRPNPRIEVILHKDKGFEIGEGKRLEESFLSESLSDTEETGSDESSPKVSEDGSSSSAELTTEETEEEFSVAGLNPANSVEEVKKELKPKFFTWKKAMGLLVVLLIGCSFTNSPIFEVSSYKDLGMSTFYNPSQINEYTETSFDVLVRGFKQMTTYISRLTQIAEVDEFEPVQFANLTTLLENPFDDGFLKENHIAERSQEEVYAQEDEPEIVEEIEAEGENLEEPETYVEAEEVTLDENLQESEPCVEAEIIEGEGIEVNEQVQSDEAEANTEFEDQTVTLEVPEQVLEAKPEAISSLANTGFEDQPLTLEAPELVLEAKPQAISSVETEHVEVSSSGTEFVPSDAEINPESSSFGSEDHGSEVDSSLLNLSGEKLSENYYKQVVLPLVALALVIIATAIYFKQSQAGASRNEAIADPAMTKKVSPEKEASQIWGQEVDLAGESCPSEMSSFERTSSYNSKRGFRGSEAQSQERKQRKVSKRESLASSSSEFSMSPSYGSFTTYEKIPSKHGYGEEEMVTPVRRSSRINKITSP